MTCLRELFWLSVKFDFVLSAVHLKGELNYLADMVSRLDVPTQSRKFLKMINPVSGRVKCYNNMSISIISGFAGDISDSEALTREVKAYTAHTYAECTKAVYKSQMLAYIRFCMYYGHEPVPAEQSTILSYTAL